MTSSPKPRKKKNYINNADFYEAIKVHQERLKKNPDISPSDYIGLCFMAMSKKISNKLCFSGYTNSWKEDFLGDSIENCVKALNNFDPEKSNNPFGYFSRCIHNAFMRRIQKEKKQQYIKLKLTQHTFIVDNLDGEGIDRTLYENNEAYIEEFEASRERKKAKKAPKQKMMKKKVGLDKLL
jgi:DNA-directed RNA polymerase specialized sigma subunit